MLKLKHTLVCSNTLVTWYEELTHWKRTWCWEKLRLGGEGGNRGQDDWMASLTQWTWVCANSGRYWRTGKPGVLQSMGAAECRAQLSNQATITTKSPGLRAWVDVRRERKWGVFFSKESCIKKLFTARLCLSTKRNGKWCLSLEGRAKCLSV